ncbi:MAG TPA: hypothetical protein VMW64_00905 [Dehalococcoidia bacterium]|nr:hypothetical protein [Dehalococcoidia bacterium]
MDNGRLSAMQRFFSTADKPVSARELKELRESDPAGFEKLAEECEKATLPQKITAKE